MGEELFAEAGSAVSGSGAGSSGAAPTEPRDLRDVGVHHSGPEWATKGGHLPLDVVVSSFRSPAAVGGGCTAFMAVPGRRASITRTSSALGRRCRPIISMTTAAGIAGACGGRAAPPLHRLRPVQVCLPQGCFLIPWPRKMPRRLEMPLLPSTEWPGAAGRRGMACAGSAPGWSLGPRVACGRDCADHALRGAHAQKCMCFYAHAQVCMCRWRPALQREHAHCVHLVVARSGRSGTSSGRAAISAHGS